MTIAALYAPGACNIGSAEIRRRRQLGWGGVMSFVVAAVTLAALSARPEFYLILLFPAFAASAGFVQARYRFCFYFGFATVFNFDRTGRRVVVADAGSRRLDRLHAMRVLAVAAGVTAVVTGAGYALAVALS